jgi:NAD(P)H-hydrate repair Nnr-like enzyme with NAD(P)H-hydrate dehydratase domain
VLGGTIAALLARGLEPFESACAAVYGHARAGRIAAERIGNPESVVAGDVIEALPQALLPERP